MPDNVIGFPGKPGNEPAANDISTAPVIVQVKALYVSKRRMSAAFFKQIKCVTLQQSDFPTTDQILGWVMLGEPWLLFTVDGKLRRARCGGWGYRDPKDPDNYEKRTPLTDTIEQLFI